MNPALPAPGQLVEIAAASEQFQKKRGGRSCSSFVRRWLRSRWRFFLFRKPSPASLLS
jgi:hypothetical protein